MKTRTENPIDAINKMVKIISDKDDLDKDDLDKDDLDKDDLDKDDLDTDDIEKGECDKCGSVVINDIVKSEEEHISDFINDLDKCE